MPAIPVVAATKKQAPAKPLNIQKQETGWNTSSEMAFIDNIGSFRSGAPKPLPDTYRIELLRKYQAAILNRTHWGSMDRTAIETHINVSILKLTN